MKTIYLTFDIDWASDDVIRDTITLLLEHKARATFFITHPSSVLNELREHDDSFELGIHPNFNNLLTLNEVKSNYVAILQYSKSIVPEAICARSHSMTQSSLIWDALLEMGIYYDLNTLIPAHTGISLKPFRASNGLIRVPYCWEDDDHMDYGLSWDPHPVVRNNGLLVLDFHPIHVFLNTESMERYEKTLTFSDNVGKLRRMVNNDSDGCRTFLLRLLSESEVQYGLIREIECPNIE